MNSKKYKIFTNIVIAFVICVLALLVLFVPKYKEKKQASGCIEKFLKAEQIKDYDYIAECLYFDNNVEEHRQLSAEGVASVIIDNYKVKAVNKISKGFFKVNYTITTKEKADLIDKDYDNYVIKMNDKLLVVTNANQLPEGYREILKRD